MSDINVDVLKNAVDRNIGAVLTLPRDGLLHHFKSRFLGSVEGRILLEAPKNEDSIIAEVIAKKSPAAVCFHNGVEKVAFTSPIVRAERGFKVSNDIAVDAVFLEFPTEIKSVQRRKNYRVSISPPSNISLKIWRIFKTANLKERPMPSQEIKAQLIDLCVGGAGVRLLGKDHEVPEISVEDRLRLEFNLGNEQNIVVEGKMRLSTRSTKEGVLLTGIQFKKLDADLDGRRALTQITKLVGELQLLQMRSARGDHRTIA